MMKGKDVRRKVGVARWFKLKGTEKDRIWRREKKLLKQNMKMRKRR